MTDRKYLDTHILDIREELEELVPHFQWFGLRQIDYNSRCSCFGVTNPDGIPARESCRRCFRSGYLFVDYLIKGYMWISTLGFEFKTKVGEISTQRTNLILQHNRAVNKFDYILVLDKNPDTGVLRQPLSVMRTYQVQDSVPLIGKQDRIEFYKCSLEERNLDDGRPGDGGTQYNYKGNRSNAEPF